MSSMMLNLDLGGSHSQSKAGHDHSNQNHKRFLKRRRVLERRGFLRPRQLPQHVHPHPPWIPYQWHFNPQQFSGFRQRNGNSFGYDGFYNFFPYQKVFPKVNHAHSFDGPDARKGSLVVTVDSNANDSRSATFVTRGKKTGGPGPVKPSMSHKKVSDKDQLRSHSETDRINLTNEDGCLPPITVSKFPYKLVAIDCEMVGTGPGGRHSDLARCTVVSYHGDVVYDKYIQPLNPITDFRTRWSGIRKQHMKNATPFKAAQKEILKILYGKVVVGHAIINDFKALHYFHPKALTRDTSQIPLLNRKAGFNEKEAASLKRLTKQLLSRDIQVGKNGHSSVEDAKATMDLYRIVEVEWERKLASNFVQN